MVFVSNDLTKSQRLELFMSVVANHYLAKRFHHIFNIIRCSDIISGIIDSLYWMQKKIYPLFQILERENRELYQHYDGLVRTKRPYKKQKLN